MVKLSTLIVAVVLGCGTGMIKLRDAAPAKTVAEQKLEAGKVHLVGADGSLSVLGECAISEFGNIELWLRDWPKAGIRRLAILDQDGAEVKMGDLIQCTIHNYDAARDHKTSRLWSFGEVRVTAATSAGKNRIIELTLRQTEQYHPVGRIPSATEPVRLRMVLPTPRGG